MQEDLFHVAATVEGILATLGTPPPAPNQPAPQAETQQQKAAKGKMKLQQSDYLMNIEVQNKAVQDANWKTWDKQRRSDNRGVEVQEAY